MRQLAHCRVCILLSVTHRKEYESECKTCHVKIRIKFIKVKDKDVIFHL